MAHKNYTKYKHPPPPPVLGTVHGKIGDITYLKRRGVPFSYGRFLEYPHQLFSDAQIRARQCLGSASKAWLFVSDTDRSTFADAVPYRAFSNNSRRRHPKKRTAFAAFAHLYTKECLPMVLFDQPPLTSPIVFPSGNSPFAVFRFEGSSPPRLRFTLALSEVSAANPAPFNFSVNLTTAFTDGTPPITQSRNAPFKGLAGYRHNFFFSTPVNKNKSYIYVVLRSPSDDLTFSAFQWALSY